MNVIRIVACVIGGFGVSLGLLGLVAPESFVALVGFMQDPPWAYLAAVNRFVVGAFLFHVAPTSRSPLAVRLLGAVIAVGGLLTPLFGIWGGHAILSWWSSGGPALVRACAAVSVAFGAFILHSIAFSLTRRAA